MRTPPKELLAEVRAVYLELARRPLQRNCLARTECCQFNLTGLTPHLTKGEALLAAKAFRATGRCLIYADRPFGCHTHFCDAAGGPYARKEVLDLIRRLEDLDVRLKGDGPRKLFAAVADALEE